MGSRLFLHPRFESLKAGLYDGSYNTCRNLEWQVCAALGYLNGQLSRDIRFAFRPGDLRPENIGDCVGYHPAGCGDDGYASADIF